MIERTDVSMFQINWSRDWDELSIEYYYNGLWLNATRSNRYTNGSTVVPLMFVECETLGL